MGYVHGNQVMPLEFIGDAWSKRRELMVLHYYSGRCSGGCDITASNERNLCSIIPIVEKRASFTYTSSDLRNV